MARSKPQALSFFSSPRSNQNNCYSSLPLIPRLRRQACALPTIVCRCLPLPNTACQCLPLHGADKPEKVDSFLSHIPSPGGNTKQSNGVAGKHIFSGYYPINRTSYTHTRANAASGLSFAKKLYSLTFSPSVTNPPPPLFEAKPIFPHTFN
jgi:hypothetical protein